ncbi:MAG TPA: DUF3854 domain-containing protein [Methylomirabilota bacterium]|nr:DUF3854 domain-containing protein [Methylomirabilota bacterium]
MNAYLAHLLSRVYDGALAPEHRADLSKSGLSDETIATQKIRSIPPAMIEGLLGFEAPKVCSAYLIPFADPRGGWFDHVRMKVFPPIATDSGTIKYLQPKRSGVRIYFPLATLDAVLRSAAPVYFVEGEKKALGVAQLGLLSIGICGIEGWHVAGSRALHPDLDDVGLRGRTVYLVPDADVRTNGAVHRAVHRLVDALGARGVAEAKMVLVPPPFKGIDDFLAATA